MSRFRFHVNANPQPSKRIRLAYTGPRVNGNLNQSSIPVNFTCTEPPSVDSFNFEFDSYEDSNSSQQPFSLLSTSVSHSQQSIPADYLEFPQELAYFNALDAARAAGSVVFLPGCWVLIREFREKLNGVAQYDRLSATRYQLVSVAYTGFICNCKVDRCLHVAYLIYRHRTSLEFARFPSHNYTLQPQSVTLIREFPKESRIRRIFAVISGPRSMPAVVLQNNNQSNWWTCRHCQLENGCLHIAAAYGYCKEAHETIGGDFMGQFDYQPQRKRRKISSSISLETIEIPEFLRRRTAIPSSTTSSTVHTAVNSVKALGENAIDAIILDQKDRKSVDPLILQESAESCPDCSGSLALNQSFNGKLYCNRSIIDVVVQSLRCEKCSKILHYEGREDSIFNYNNSLLFSHFLLNSYTSQFCTQSCPFTAFVTAQKQNYENCGVDSSFISIPTFISVWFSFVKLQNWQLNYSCPRCLNRPKMIFCDGTGLSIKRSRASNLRSPCWIDESLPTRESTSVGWDELVAFAEPTRAKLDSAAQLLSEASNDK